MKAVALLLAIVIPLLVFTVARAIVKRHLEHALVRKVVRAIPVRTKLLLLIAQAPDVTAAERILNAAHHHVDRRTYGILRRAVEARRKAQAA